MKQFLVKISGEVVVSGETHSDVKECLTKARLECPASVIKFLDIDRIQTHVVEEMAGPHPHN